jgi:hypothetical protein
VFARMLASALEKESESVYIDLVTFQDIEILKAKRMNNENKLLKANSVNAKK